MDGEIEPETVADQLDGDDPLVVDIRDPDAYRQGHIPDSVNVPLSELVGAVDRVADADRVVTVCPHGKASVKAARLIGSYENFGGRVESMAGGLTAWDGPLEHGATDDGAGAGEESTDEGPQAPF